MFWSCSLCRLYIEVGRCLRISLSSCYCRKSLVFSLFFVFVRSRSLSQRSMNNLDNSCDTSILFSLDWRRIFVDMVSRSETKSKTLFDNRNICPSKPILQCKSSSFSQNKSSISSSSLFVTRKSVMLSSFQTSSRHNDFSTSIYAITIIIFCATWIFKKATYVNLLFPLSSILSFLSIERNQSRSILIEMSETEKERKEKNKPQHQCKSCPLDHRSNEHSFQITFLLPKKDDMLYSLDRFCFFLSHSNEILRRFPKE